MPPFNARQRGAGGGRIHAGSRFVQDVDVVPRCCPELVAWRDPSPDYANSVLSMLFTLIQKHRVPGKQALACNYAMLSVCWPMREDACAIAGFTGAACWPPGIFR